MQNSITKLTARNKQEIEPFLFNCISSQEEGIIILDEKVGNEEHGFVDFLGIDKEKRLVLYYYDVLESDTMLVYALDNFNWACENSYNIRKMYKEHEINANLVPRIILVAPSFSTRMRRSIVYLDFMRVDLFEYKYLAVNEAKGLMIEPVRIPHKLVRPQASTDIKQKILGEMVRATEDEVDAFLQFDVS